MKEEPFVGVYGRGSFNDYTSSRYARDVFEPEDGLVSFAWAAECKELDFLTVYSLHLLVNKKVPAMFRYKINPSILG